MALCLHPSWKYIAARAWSFRFAAGASLCSGIAAGLTAAQPYLGISPVKTAWLILVATVGATWLGISAMAARLMKQKNFDGI